MAKKKLDEELDTTTSFADMNVEGFRWYNPSAKKNKDMKKVKTKVTGKEYRAMVWGSKLLLRLSLFQSLFSVY